MNLNDLAMKHVPRHQHQFWLDNIWLILAVLASVSATLTTGAFWSAHAGAVVSYLGAAVCTLFLIGYRPLHRALSGRPIRLAYFLGIGLVSIAIAFSLGAYGLVFGGHAALSLTPWIGGGIAILAVFGLFFKLKPFDPPEVPDRTGPTDSSRDPVH